MPLNPNELTPAKRISALRCHGVSVVGTRNVCLRGIGEGSAPDNVDSGGISSLSSASAALINPAIPEAASRCPRFVFVAPSAQGFFRRQFHRSPPLMPRLRSGLPAPFLCHVFRRSQCPRGRHAPYASAALITSRCAMPFGAVMTLVRPS